MPIFYMCGIHEVDINDEYKGIYGCDCEKAKEVSNKFDELIFTVPVKKLVKEEKEVNEVD